MAANLAEIVFWSKEFIGSQLSELLIPILVLVGSSILFGVWGDKCAKVMGILGKYLSVLLHLELKITEFSNLVRKTAVGLASGTFRPIERSFDQSNFVLAELGEKISKSLRFVQTGISNMNILFLMGGVFLLLLTLIIL